MKKKKKNGQNEFPQASGKRAKKNYECAEHPVLPAGVTPPCRNLE